MSHVYSIKTPCELLGHGVNYKLDYINVNNYFLGVFPSAAFTHIACKMPYNQRMKKEFAIYKAGSVLSLAKMLGISRAAIYQWSDDVPASRVWQLKVLHPEWFDCMIV
jgi:hypothetical protein